MKTKLYKQFTIALISLLFLAGCSSSFLDMNQPGVTKVINYYKTDADATGAITSCYNMMRAMNASVWTSFWMTKESLSDDIYTGGENSGDRPEYQELNKFTFMVMYLSYYMNYCQPSMHSQIQHLLQILMALLRLQVCTHKSRKI